MMTAVMMKADTRPARRGSNVGDSCCTVARTHKQNTQVGLDTAIYKLTS